MNLAERARIALMSAGRAQRHLALRVLSIPQAIWRYGASTHGQLLIVPQDLRTADGSFWQELQLGQLGLAGTAVRLDDRSPFAVRPPNVAWQRALHGFGWLRHLDAADDPEARETARRLAVEWTVLERSYTGVAWEPAVIGRRIISWLSHADFLLDGADEETYDAIARSLEAQLTRLASVWRAGADGYPRILALTAIALADLSIAGRDSDIAAAESLLVSELDRQVLEDGGHVSRNPAVPVELMLDLLPLRQCFAARGRPIPPALQQAVSSMIAMLRYMRLGDGRLARFNGVSVASPASLATVLAYDDKPGAQLEVAPSSGFVRLQRGATLLIGDAGRAPPLEFSGEAHAGCLSFELSVGSRLVFVNGGAPGPADREWTSKARATASHNTLELGETSSARLVKNTGLSGMIGGLPIKGPERVSSNVEDTGTSLVWTASHDGYLKRTGLIHRREVALSTSGSVLEGIDRLGGTRPGFRLAKDIPFAIHFHFHPDIRCRIGPRPELAEIVVPDGAIWHFMADGAPLSIEESTFFADSSGPRHTLQIVLRGATYGESEVRWRLEQKA